MRPVADKGLQRTIDVVSADTVSPGAQAPLIAPYPSVERTTMKTEADNGPLGLRKLFMLLAASLSWVLVAAVIWVGVKFIVRLFA